MQESTLLKLALGWSLIGILILILIALFTAPAEIEIRKAEENLGKEVIVTGQVSSASYHEKVSFIDLEDSSGKILVVLFEQPKLEVQQGDELKVKGQVKLYKGELELVASEIICIKCGS